MFSLSQSQMRDMLQSQQQSAPSLSQPVGYACALCNKVFSTDKGRSIHLSTCRFKHRTVPSAEITARTAAAVVVPPVPNETALPDRPPPAPVWGQMTAIEVKRSVDKIYDEIVYWRRNVFLLPSGSAGKNFVNEMTRLIEAWNTGVSPLNDFAIKAVMIMPSLLLQKPSYKSGAKQHTECLARRLESWKNADFEALIREARVIQCKLQSAQNAKTDDPENVGKIFAKLMLQGKVNAAIKLLDRVNVGSVLPLCTDTVQKLKLKHPNGSEAKQSALLTGEVPFCDPAMFNNLDENRIRQAALRTRGSCGPSGMDANGWRHILASKSFGKAGKELCTAVADFAKILCRRDIVVQPECSSSLEAYTACRLIPLDKKPGVRPIGVGEILRRIVGKAIVSVVKPEIMESAGSLQLCAGLPGGCEAAFHAMSFSRGGYRCHIAC